MYSNSLINSENERIAIQEIPKGKFKRQFLLKIYDDFPSDAVALHLLDSQTVDWLLVELNKIKEKTNHEKDISRSQ